MKTKHCLIAFCLVSAILPVMALGADADQMDQGEYSRGKSTRPRVQIRSIPLVQVEVESGTIHILFSSDLGVVSLQLQDVTGFTAVDQQINTSVQNKASFNLPTGTYTLTVIAADEALITQINLIIP